MCTKCSLFFFFFFFCIYEFQMMFHLVDKSVIKWEFRQQQPFKLLGTYVDITLGATALASTVHKMTSFLLICNIPPPPPNQLTCNPVNRPFFSNSGGHNCVNFLMQLTIKVNNYTLITMADAQEGATIHTVPSISCKEEGSHYTVNHIRHHCLCL